MVCPLLSFALQKCRPTPTPQQKAWWYGRSAFTSVGHYGTMMSRTASEEIGPYQNAGSHLLEASPERPQVCAALVRSALALSLVIAFHRSDFYLHTLDLQSEIRSIHGTKGSLVQQTSVTRLGTLSGYFHVLIDASVHVERASENLGLDLRLSPMFQEVKA